MAAGETKPRAPLRTSLSLLGRVRPPNLRGEREESGQGQTSSSGSRCLAYFWFSLIQKKSCQQAAEMQNQNHSRRGRDMGQRGKREERERASEPLRRKERERKMSCNNCLIRHGAGRDGNTKRAGRRDKTVGRPQKHLLGGQAPL